MDKRIHYKRFLLYSEFSDLEHVVEEVEFDDGLALDDVVHHGGVDVRHGVDAHRDDQPLQQVDHLRGVQQVRARPAQHVPAKTTLVQCLSDAL